MASLLIRSQRVVLPDGVRPAEIRVDDGQIVSISSSRHPGTSGTPGTGTVIDAGSAVVMPGLVDTHVHINDPGRADWEGFETATLAGGRRRRHDARRHAAQQHSGHDHRRRARGQAARRGGHAAMSTSVSGAASFPAMPRDIEPLARAGVLGFKCFLSPSGVDEFDHVSEADLREAMPIIAATGLPLLVHAELPALLREPDRRADPRSYATWLDSRPATAEQAAIDLLIELSGTDIGARAHRAPRLRRRARVDRRSARQGPAAHRRDLPALPDVRRRGHRRRRHGVEVRAADPRGRASRAVVARARRTG